MQLKRQAGAFTLIELLVVAAIIALLISILVPALAGARGQARGVQCLGHCRELAHGMTIYYSEWGNYPVHQWIFAEGTRLRWFQAMANYLGGFKVQGCPGTPAWEVGRNNSYGYNYKYLGSGRDNVAADNLYRPYESFPIRNVRAPAQTIAFGDSDGTGWTAPWGPDLAPASNPPDRLGNHGYVLDPTYIPLRALTTYSGGVLEPYAWKFERTYISDRHLGRSSLVFADAHGARLTPREVYVDNRLWNGLGFDPGDDPNSPWFNADRHVDYKVSPNSTLGWRYGDFAK